MDEGKGRRGRRPLWRVGNGPRAAVLRGADHNAGNGENAARMGGVFIGFLWAAGRTQRGDPLLRFFGTRGFRALRRAARGAAPGPRPLFCKKAGQKTFRRQSTSGPNPSPLGRVIQSVREADTLAAEWQLPREWERRAGPETSRGRHHPKRFSLGLHPVSLGKTKEMGWNSSTS